MKWQCVLVFKLVQPGPQLSLKRMTTLICQYLSINLGEFGTKIIQHTLMVLAILTVDYSDQQHQKQVSTRFMLHLVIKCGQKLIDVIASQTSKKDDTVMVLV